MATRIIVTAAVLAMAVGASWGDALDSGHLFNPFAILLLLLAVLVWFGWGALRAAYRAAKNGSERPATPVALDVPAGVIARLAVQNEPASLPGIGAAAASAAGARRTSS